MNRPPCFSGRGAPFEAVALIALTATLSVSCRQILGIETRKLKDETPDAGDGPSDVTRSGFAEPSAECAKCVDHSCSSEETACHADVACRAAYQCLQACKPGDADCATWCLGSYSRPQSLATLTACVSASCESACTLSCGVLVNGSSTCDACVQKNCCDENRACASSEACVDIDFCSNRCLPAGSARCASDCAATYSSGKDESAARSSCVSANCTDACSSDNAWSCLDHRQQTLKPPTLDPIDFHMTVVEFLAETPYQGLTVKACSTGDIDCDSPLATATSDDDGSFDLTVPLGANGFDGYLDLSGSTLFPTLYYFIPPMIVGGDRGRLRLPSTGTITLLAAGIKVDLDPTRGHLAVVPWDCTLTSAPGVSISIDALDSKATQYYFLNNAPNRTATQTASDPSLGGAVNLPTGLTLVTTTVVSLGETSSQFNFNIRAGTLTAGGLPPLP